MRDAIILSAISNPTVKAWRALNKQKQERERAGVFLAEGEHMAQEAFGAGAAQALIVEDARMARYGALVALFNAADKQVYIVSPKVMEALCEAKTPQGVVALCAPCALPSGAGARLVVALDAVQDPGNVGTVVRTLDAIGGCSLLMSRECADAFSPKALRASMGGIFRVPVKAVDALAPALNELKAAGYPVYAGALDGSPYYQRALDAQKVCLVIGNEGAGISASVLQCATHRFKLPMQGGAESLNAAVACAIMAYDLVRVWTMGR